MQSTTLEFPHSARTVYTAIKRLFSKQTGFSSVDCNDDLFVVEARHGAWISPFSENVKMKVVATATQSSKVVVESSSRSILNLLNFGANKDNVSNLSDYINNEYVYFNNIEEVSEPVSSDKIVRWLKNQTNVIICRQKIYRASILGQLKKIQKLEVIYAMNSMRGNPLPKEMSASH